MPVQIAPIARESLLDQAVPSLQVGGILGQSQQYTAPFDVSNAELGVVGATTAAMIGHRAVFATTVGVQCFYLGTSTFCTGWSKLGVHNTDQLRCQARAFDSLPEIAHQQA